MYLPKHFAETDVTEMHALMRARPLATLAVSYTHLDVYKRQLFERAVAEGFLRNENRAMALAAGDIESLLAVMTAYRPEPVSKWLKEEKQL